MLFLFPVAYRDDSFLTASEFRLELPYHLCLSTLTTYEREHLHPPEHVILVERQHSHVHLVLFSYVVLERIGSSSCCMRSVPFTTLSLACRLLTHAYVSVGSCGTFSRTSPSEGCLVCIDRWSCWHRDHRRSITGRSC
eukprot:NODE_5_length_49639_cov_0.484336.p22 type:complete len:138 gc:universal NODE_5_length_49639_cov_0.484336:39380-39793(+)